MLGGFLLGGIVVSSIIALASLAQDGNGWTGVNDVIAVEETPEEAIERYTEEIREQPNSASLYVNRAEAYEQIYDFEAASDDYGTAIALEPRSAELYAARASLHEWSESGWAVRDYTTAIELDPERSEYFSGRASAHEQIGNNRSALDDYSSAIDLKPGDLDLYSSRAWVHLRLGNDAAAVADHTEIIDSDPSARRYWARADVHTRLGNHGAAIEDYTQAYELDPENGFYLQARAAAHATEGDAEAALADYGEAIAIEPDWPPFGQRGDLLWSLGRHDEAMADFDAAVEVDELSGRYRRSIALVALGRPDKALNDLDYTVSHTLEYGSDYVASDYGIVLEDVYYHRAVARANAGDLSGAAADLERALAEDYTVGRPQIIDDRVGHWLNELEGGVNPFAGTP